MSTRIMTGKVRLSYANLFEPKSINGSDPKYSVALLIPKTDTDTIAKVEKAIEQALQEGIGKFGGKMPPRGALRLPLRDGDTERDADEYAGHYFINANSKTKPGVVDQNVQPIIDPEEVYSGCYARATVTFFAYSASGNKGVGAALGNVQKLADGDRLAGGPSAESEFTAVATDNGFPTADATPFDGGGDSFLS